MSRINEGSTARLAITWLDYDGEEAAPESVSYRVDCTTTGEAVRAETSLTPAATMNLILTPDDTAILGDGTEPEQRVATFVATWDGGAGQTTQEYRFTVWPLAHYPLS